jgi:ribose-phosphate pyrophosphokinase
VVCPDFGYAKNASKFARILGLDVAAGNKRRISDSEVIIDTIVGDVRGKDCIVVDDEIANGGSMLELLDRLRDAGARRFRISCTHGVLVRDAVCRLAESEDVEEIVTTNTIPIGPEKMHPKLKVLSVAPLLGDAIHRIHFGLSVSSLFH